MNITSIPIPENPYTYHNSLKRLEDEMIKIFALSDIILRKPRTASTERELLAILRHKGEQFAPSRI